MSGGMLYLSHTSPSTLSVTKIIPVQRVNYNTSIVLSTNANEVSSVPVVSPTVVQSNGVDFYKDSIIKFNYLAKDQANIHQNLQVILSGNRLYLTHQGEETFGAPFIEIFQKDPKDTIQEAIKKDVLSGYNLTDCPIVKAYAPSSSITTGWDSASINYAQLQGYIGAAAPNNFNQSKCPSDYISTSTISYFEVDPKHSNYLIYLWVNNGIYPAGTTGHNYWFQSIQFSN